MCSALIILANSCYTDNFQLIGSVLGKGITLGVVIGTVVGVLALFVKNINS